MTKVERENWQSEMFSLIKQWQSSGIRQKDFCNKHDIPLHTFHYYFRKYKRSLSPPASSFLQVEVDPPKNGPGDDIQIHYPNGVMISLDKQIPVSRLKSLIKAF